MTTSGGTPSLRLETGNTDQAAVYASGSGTNTLSFTYTVQAGDTSADLEYVDTSSLALNGGRILSSAGTAADLTLPTLGTENSLAGNKSIRIDTTAPTSVAGVDDGTTSAAPGQSPPITWSAATDADGSGVSGYLIALGTTSGGTDIVDWTDVGNITSKTVTGLGLFDHITYFASVRAIDLAGNLGAVSSGNGWTTSLCPSGYLGVPALTGYNNAEFCVAKYEAKNVAGVATSQASDVPWRSLSQTAAITACQAQGAGYDLITNDEWQSLARNIENVAWNWSGSTVGAAGGLSRGFSDENYDGNTLPVAADVDSSPCAGTGATCDLSSWHVKRRVHRLNNGNQIWDVAGNVSEWVKENLYGQFGANSTVAAVSDAAVKTRFGPSGSFASLSTDPYGGLGLAFINSNNSAVYRGGYWALGGGMISAGIFTVGLDMTPSSTSAALGFRCVYRPLDFSFASVIDAVASATVTSTSITARHFSGTRDISVSGEGNPQLVVNGVASGTTGSLSPGDTLAVRLTSAPAAPTTRTATVHLGTETADFKVTTGYSSLQTLFANATPGTPDSGDTAAVELGVKFYGTTDGFIRGIRFYRAAANAGGYTVHLWDTIGNLLATATTTDGAIPGWQEALFATPFAIHAHKTYIASYYTSNGRYAIDTNVFNSTVISGDLTAPSDAAALGNGVFSYGGGFPNGTYSSSNYYVDVLFIK